MYLKVMSRKHKLRTSSGVIRSFPRDVIVLVTNKYYHDNLDNFVNNFNIVLINRCNKMHIFARIINLNYKTATFLIQER